MENIIKIIIKYRIYLICIIIILLSIISISFQYINRKNTISINSKTFENKEDKIAIYITGEIKKPGVYYMDKNSRLENIIDLSGGTTEDADISKINLAQKLNDSDKIIIPKKEVKVVDEDNEDYIQDYDENNENIGQKININKAGLEELMNIPGIGEVTANKIIEYRKNHFFSKIEDIMEVPGIGTSKFNNLKDKICVE